MSAVLSTIRAIFLKSRFETLEKPDTVRIESTLAVSRAFLSICSFIAIYLDPTEPGRFAGVAYTLLLAHVSYSLCLALYANTLKYKPTIRLRYIQEYIHATDVIWAVALTLFSQGPTSSPFFAFFIFALISAAFRWYLAETLMTTAILVLFLLWETFLVAIPNSLLGPGEPIEVNRLIVRTGYLTMVGILFGYLAANEKQQRTEIALMAEIGRNIRSELGLTGAARATLESLLHVYNARQVWLFMHDHRSERLTAWRGLRGSNGIAEISMSEDLIGGGSLPDLPKQPDFCGEFVFRDEWTATVNVFDASKTVPSKDGARFLRAAMDQIGPGMYSAFLVDRLQSRAGVIERARLARELHDGIIQSLVGAEMRIEALRRNMERGESASTDDLGDVQQLLHNEVLSLRELMQQMKPVEIGPKELLDFIAERVDRFRRDTGIATKFHTDLQEVSLSPAICQEVARILQELLTNIRKHSGAHHGFVRFGRQDGSWKLSVEDDGHGFSFTGRRTLSELDLTHQGPLTVKERVRAVGGELVLESIPGKGSLVEITFPAKDYDRKHESHSYSHR